MSGPSAGNGTARAGPGTGRHLGSCDDLTDLDRILVDEADEVRAVLGFHDDAVVCPFYCSVDIRRNASKAAVVDANAFPAGFNNLPAGAIPSAIDVATGYLHRNYPRAQRLAILGESHSRNAAYFESLRQLATIVRGAGYEVDVATMNPDIADGAHMPTLSGASIQVHQARRAGDQLVVAGHAPDAVLLNHDLSDGVPDLLKDIAQPINPPTSMGWHRRKKSEHFAIVAELARQLGEHVGFDPWLVTAEFERVEGLDFKAGVNVDKAARAIDAVIARTQAKYDEHGIERAPSVFVKADAGTYGMAITTATSGAAFVQGLNSKARQEMDRGKGKVKTQTVIVQETVPTDIRDDQGFVAEPVLYMVCSRPVGAFHRLHAQKGDADNLNAPGSRFEPLGFPGQGGVEMDACSAHVYSVLGQLASIATGYEMRAAQGKPGVARFVAA